MAFELLTTILDENIKRVVGLPIFRVEVLTQCKYIRGGLNTGEYGDLAALEQSMLTM